MQIYCTAMIWAAALMLSSADAHGYLGLPAVTFPNDVDKTQFVATIESSASGFSGSFSGSPAENTAAFSVAFNSSKYTSLKEFVTDLGQIVASGANIECGLTDPNETPQSVPNELEWVHSDTEGFTSSHEGPCEAWCDNTRVFQDTDCAAHFTTAPAKMPYNKAGCAGANRLTFYWLALHSPTWQVYVDCAALEGGSSSSSRSSSTTSGSTGQSETPTATLATPKSGTATPSVATANPSVSTALPSFTNSVSGDKGDECDSLDVAGSDEEEEDCGSLNIAGSDDDEIASDADTTEEDCGSLDLAGSEEDEDCDSLDVAGSETHATTFDTISESSLNFGDVGGSYISGKVQEQNYT
ncbi:unnamed protein product [Phytophthora fragariaefolia]|uniref:Unnamed protein product n=1 Tax=Phytophthora fragariaefolia TaxID=1490495 RepID=A0A9W6XDW0_9STRA|nr:unnamed protein product [Phytophthora fragariaefolia]